MFAQHKFDWPEKEELGEEEDKAESDSEFDSEFDSESESESDNDNVGEVINAQSNASHLRPRLAGKICRIDGNISRIRGSSQLLKVP